MENNRLVLNGMLLFNFTNVRAFTARNVVLIDGVRTPFLMSGTE